MQRTKLKNTYRSLEEILSCVLQGPILGLHLFNIFISDIFSIMNKVNLGSYADNTPHVTGDSLAPVIETLKEASDQIFC